MAKIILDEVLKKKRISKRKFAKMLGVSYVNVFRLFRNPNPTFKTMQRWARLLRVKVRDLIRG